MSKLTKKIAADYDGYKMIEYIFSDGSCHQELFNIKTYDHLFLKKDDLFKSTKKQLHRYLKYIITNSCYMDHIQVIEASDYE